MSLLLSLLPPLCVCVSLFLSLSACLSVCLYLCLCPSACLSLYIYVCLSVSVFLCLSYISVTDYWSFCVSSLSVLPPPSLVWLSPPCSLQQTLAPSLSPAIFQLSILAGQRRKMEHHKSWHNIGPRTVLQRGWLPWGPAPGGQPRVREAGAVAQLPGSCPERLVCSSLFCPQI